MNIENKISTDHKQPLKLSSHIRMSDHWNSPLWEDFSYYELIDEEEPPIDPEYDDLAGGLK